MRSELKILFHDCCASRRLVHPTNIIYIYDIAEQHQHWRVNGRVPASSHINKAVSRCWPAGHLFAIDAFTILPE